MPAEWEPHQATWLAWPHEKSDWPGKFEPIPWLYGEIVRHLARVERVRILVEDADAEQRVRRILKKCHADLAAIEFFHQPTNRSWTRDFCPLFVNNRAGEVAATEWKFNGWAKYDNYERDAAVPRSIASPFEMRSWAPGLVLEGGAIDVNGAGKLLATEECLLSEVQARNPGVSRPDGTRARRLPGRNRGNLARTRHRRRRHPRPYRRCGAVHLARHCRGRGRARSIER
jgi:agmatine deiminase